MLPRVGDFVITKMRVERVAQRGRTKVVSRRKAVTDMIGQMVSGPKNGKVFVKATGIRDIKDKKWIEANFDFIVEVALDDVEEA